MVSAATQMGEGDLQPAFLSSRMVESPRQCARLSCEMLVRKALASLHLPEFGPILREFPMESGRLPAWQCNMGSGPGSGWLAGRLLSPLLGLELSLGHRREEVLLGWEVLGYLRMCANPAQKRGCGRGRREKELCTPQSQGWGHHLAPVRSCSFFFHSIILNVSWKWDGRRTRVPAVRLPQKPSFLQLGPSITSNATAGDSLPRQPLQGAPCAGTRSCA